MAATEYRSIQTLQHSPVGLDADKYLFLYSEAVNYNPPRYGGLFW